MRNKYGVAFIGTVGIPNRYGGFESFVENVAPFLSDSNFKVAVTCYRGAYSSFEKEFNGVDRIFLGVKANGPLSVIHDFYGFLLLILHSRNIVMLGTSAGPFFPLMRIICTIVRSKLIVNLDGVEWRRQKYNHITRAILYAFDIMAQLSANLCVYDNGALKGCINSFSRDKSVCIEYSGDHVARFISPDISIEEGTALTICRIEPENNINILIEGVMMCDSIKSYTIIGNWKASTYAIQLAKQYEGNPKINLIDPVYEPKDLNIYRQKTQYYLHGHSVGGSNPSLIEMLFYDAVILCYDCPYNRVTASYSAYYFADSDSLRDLIKAHSRVLKCRNGLREKYTCSNIAFKYKNIFK